MTVSELETEEARAAAAGGDVKRDYVRRTFGQIAPTYDRLNHLLSLNVDRAWRRKAIAALEWTRVPTGTYVDLCAGTLDVAAELSRARGFEGRVVGADFAEPMLRAGLGKASASTVWPVVADALDLPLRDREASGAIVAFGIRNVTDLDASLREVHRVLAPGARFVILEFTTPRLGRRALALSLLLPSGAASRRRACSADTGARTPTCRDRSRIFRRNRSSPTECAARVSRKSAGRR